MKFRAYPAGWRLWVAALACAVLAACTTPLRQYELLDQPLACDKANRVVFETMQAMGFTITGVDIAKPGHPGMVKGVKELSGVEQRTQHGAVSVACNAAGVDINAREEGKILGQVDMKRGFLIAYKSVLTMAERREEMEAKIAAGTAPDKWQRNALQVLIDPLRGYAAKIEFHLDMAAGNVLPIRVTMNNRTRHRYLLGGGAIKLMRADRRRIPPLSPEEAADRILTARDPQTGDPVTTLGRAAVASRLRGKVFAAERVDPKAKVEGYLYFPLDTYKRAKVVLIEEESGESEGFLVEF